MTELVKIQLDLGTGSLEVEAPADAIDSVFTKLEHFLPRLVEAYSNTSNPELEGQSKEEPLDGGPEGNGAVEESEASEDSARRGGSKVANKRVETYRTVDLGLDQSQRDELRNFFGAKQPKTQNEQLLTIMYWLAHNGDHGSVNADEIFTGLRTVSAKAPKKISSVLGNLVGQGMVQGEGRGKYSINHVGEDFVSLQLPRKKIENEG